jgi:transcriptional regulator with XRE-family HTH domain
MNKKQIIVDIIKDTLSKKVITLSEFAQLMDVQPSVISRWLSGKHNFTIETLFNIEEKLQIQIINYGKLQNENEEDIFFWEKEISKKRNRRKV